MATIVLVPGATGGAWSWQWIVPHLQGAGHDVHAVTLTGLGDRAHLAHPGIDLETHITDVVAMLEFANLHSVTLVGHSYGGMVIAGAADRVPERINQVVYLNATVPRDGQSAYDAEGGEAERTADAAASEAAGMPGFWPVPIDWFQEAILDEAVRDRVSALSRPHPLATFAQPIRLSNPDAERVPRAFIFCTEGRDPGVPDPDYLAWVRSDPAWRYREIPFDHLAPVTAPRETAEALLALI